jgi:hypothetical protein
MSKPSLFPEFLSRYGTFVSIVMALLVPLTGAALSADPKPSEGQKPTSQAKLSAHGLYKVDRILGKPVKNPKGETLGKLSEVVIDEKGQIKYFVLAHGGILGKGTKKTAIAWKLLQFSPKGSPYLVGISKKQLAGLPTFNEDKWPTEAQVTDFEALRAPEEKAQPSAPSGRQ